jgi:GAF domain-containing protein
MAFEIKTGNTLPKEEKYKLLLPQIDLIIKDESNFIANISNITSAIKYTFDNFLWVGFYFKDSVKDDELVLGPFQGNAACTRIPFGKGVCGASAIEKKTVIVDNVDNFPGHIVCDSLSKSEIVVPVIKENQVKAVLDIDSGEEACFDETDSFYLEKLVKNILHIF